MEYQSLCFGRGIFYVRFSEKVVGGYIEVVGNFNNDIKRKMCNPTIFSKKEEIPFTILKQEDIIST